MQPQSYTMIWLVIVAIWLVIVYSVGTLADRYDRPPMRWMVLALFVGVFAFLPLLAKGPERER